MDDRFGCLMILLLHNLMRLIPGLITILVLGCGTTDMIDASDSSASNSAVILGASRGTVLFSPRAVVIKSVDGKSVAVTANSVRVSPGIHVLIVTCYQSLFARNTHELTVSVEAGETYTLSSQIVPNKISGGSEDCEARMSRSDSE